MKDDDLHNILSDIDATYNGQLELSDYIQVSFGALFNYFIPLQRFGEQEVPGEELHEILKEIDTNMNGQVELDEYLQVC